MKPVLKKIVGVSFILIAIVGILLSIIGILGIWQVRTIVLVEFLEATENILSGLEATAEGLEIVDDMVNTTAETMISTKTVTRSISQTMGDFNTLTTGLMNLMSLIPGGQLGGLNPGETSSNLSNVEIELDHMAVQINLVGSNLTETQIAIKRYHVIVADSQAQIRTAQINTPKLITTTAWVITIGLFWLVAAQVGFLIQGIEHLVSEIEQ